MNRKSILSFLSFLFFFLFFRFVHSFFDLFRRFHLFMKLRLLLFISKFDRRDRKISQSFKAISSNCFRLCRKFTNRSNSKHHDSCTRQWKKYTTLAYFINRHFSNYFFSLLFSNYIFCFAHSDSYFLKRSFSADHHLSIRFHRHTQNRLLFHQSTTTKFVQTNFDIVVKRIKILLLIIRFFDLIVIHHFRSIDFSFSFHLQLFHVTNIKRTRMSTFLCTMSDSILFITFINRCSQIVFVTFLFANSLQKMHSNNQKFATISNSRFDFLLFDYMIICSNQFATS